MKRIVVLILGLALMAPLFAQSNTFIDQVIGSRALNTAQAAYLILVASDNLSDDADASRAFEMLDQLGWIPPGCLVDSEVNYGDFCYMLMKAFGIRGGVMYQLLPSPRYAYRELKYQVVVQGVTDPMMPVSGEAAMKMIGRIFDVKGVEK